MEVKKYEATLGHEWGGKKGVLMQKRSEKNHKVDAKKETDGWRPLGYLCISRLLLFSSASFRRLMDEME